MLGSPIVRTIAKPFGKIKNRQVRQERQVDSIRNLAIFRFTKSFLVILAILAVQQNNFAVLLFPIV